MDANDSRCCHQVIRVNLEKYVITRDEADIGIVKAVLLRKFRLLFLLPLVVIVILFPLYSVPLLYNIPS
jgi:hypothetical protein